MDNDFICIDNYLVRDDTGQLWTENTLGFRKFMQMQLNPDAYTARDAYHDEI